MGVVAQPVTFPPQVRHMALLGLCVLTPGRTPFLIYWIDSMTAESTGHRSSETLMVRAVPSGTPR